MRSERFAPFRPHRPNRTGLVRLSGCAASGAYRPQARRARGADPTTERRPSG